MLQLIEHPTITSNSDEIPSFYENLEVGKLSPEVQINSGLETLGSMEDYSFVQSHRALLLCSRQSQVERLTS